MVSFSRPSSFERIEHPADDGIALHQRIAELADAGCALEALRGQIRKVRPGDRQIEEERLARRLLALHEIDAVVHQLPVDLAPHLFGVGLYHLQRLAAFGLDDLRPLVERDVEGLGLMALADHAEGVPGVRRRDAVEFVEALVLRLAIGLGAEMPFAEDRGGVAGVVQHLGHGDFVRRQRDRRARDRNQRQPGADGIAPCHQCGARRRAGRLDQELRQPQAFGGELIDAWRRRPAQLAAAVDADVAVARCCRRE